MKFHEAQFKPGRTWFFTLNLADIESSVLTRHARLLGESARDVEGLYPFETIATVILPNHLHMIWTLPEDDLNFDRRISQQEFVDGMVRLSRAYADPQSGTLHLSDLLEAPAGANKKPRETQDKKRQPRNEQISRSGMQ